MIAVKLYLLHCSRQWVTVAANFTLSLFTCPNTHCECLNLTEHVHYLIVSINYTDIPGDKSCMVPLSGLNQQHCVPPEKDQKNLLWSNIPNPHLSGFHRHTFLHISCCWFMCQILFPDWRRNRFVLLWLQSESWSWEMKRVSFQQ